MLPFTHFHFRFKMTIFNTCPKLFVLICAKSLLPDTQHRCINMFGLIDFRDATSHCLFTLYLNIALARNPDLCLVSLMDQQQIAHFCSCNNNIDILCKIINYNVYLWLYLSYHGMSAVMIETGNMLS